MKSLKCPSACGRHLCRLSEPQQFARGIRVGHEPDVAKSCCCRALSAIMVVAEDRPHRIRQDKLASLPPCASWMVPQRRQKRELAGDEPGSA